MSIKSMTKKDHHLQYVVVLNMHVQDEVIYRLCSIIVFQATFTLEVIFVDSQKVPGFMDSLYLGHSDPLCHMSYTKRVFGFPTVTTMIIWGH